MVRHYSPVKFEDDQGQRSCTGSSRTSSFSPIRTSLQVSKTQKPIGQVESADHECGKLGKCASSHGAGQYPTPSSSSGRPFRSPSPSRSYSSKDSRKSKSHRKGKTESASKITAGGRSSRSPSSSRSKSPEDRRGSSRNRKRTTGSARKSTAGGRSSRSPSFSRSKSPEDRRESSRNQKRTTGSRKRTTAGGRSFRSPSSSGSQSPEDKRRSLHSSRKSKTYSDEGHRKSPTRDESKDNGRTYSSPISSFKKRLTITHRTNGRQSRSRKVNVHRSSSISESDGSVRPRRCPSVQMKSKWNTRRAHSRRSSSSDSELRSRSHKDKAKNSRKYDYDGSSHKCSSRRQVDPRKHPKALRYDGKTSWLSFKRKFESFQKVMNWSENECKDYLLWRLEGKALDFFTITTTENERYSFRRLMKSLESRFGTKELRETSKAKFRQAVQEQEESLEDWADRMLTLATPAFADLPEDHMRFVAISRFCQGCNDREAAKHACLENPSSMEEALNLVKQHQYISLAVDGKKNRRGREGISVNAVQASSEAKTE
ncbi:serine/arginine repetitive matrix protein 2-like [Dreissena polymorpha]|nr:serine/arginine repetitive matrix protein 2-like [Dreissena polymorpha]